MLCRSGMRRRVVTLWLALILTLTVLLVAQASLTPTESALRDAIHVRAVYDVHLVNGEQGKGMTSTVYALCSATSNDSRLTTASVKRVADADLYKDDVLVQDWCALGDGMLVSQDIEWGTLLSPGIHNHSLTHTTLADIVMTCATFECDMENALATLLTKHPKQTVAQGNAALLNPDNNDLPPRLPAAYGGLDPSMPCCGSTNSTFILLFGRTPKVIVQADTLALQQLNAVAQTHLDATYCGASHLRNVAEAHTASHRCAVQASFCTLRLPDPRFYNTATTRMTWHGDGGLVSPVAVSVCGASISGVLSAEMDLLHSGYRALLTTREHADDLSLPHELINYIAAWLRGSLHDNDTVALRDSTRCAWSYKASAVTRYRSGFVYTCRLDSSIAHHLPQLTLTVFDEFVAQTSNPSPQDTTCSFALDLNPLVQAVPAERASDRAAGDDSVTDDTTYILTLYSSGSYQEQLLRPQLHQYHEPLIVIGAHYLRGATMAITRALDDGSSDDSGLTTVRLPRGLPFLYLAVYDALDTDIGPEVHASEDGMPAGCAARVKCQKSMLYVASVNRCAETQCKHLFIFHYNLKTMRCSLNSLWVGIFAAFALVLIFTEMFLLCLRARSERMRMRYLQRIHGLLLKPQE